MKKPTPKQIKSLRKKHGKTQPEIAALLYVTTRQIAYYESGENAMPLGYWELMQVKLNMQESMFGAYLK